MTKRALFAALGFLGLVLPLSAQIPARPDMFTALNGSTLSMASLALSDSRYVSLSSAIAAPLSFGWIDPTLPGPLTGSSNFATANIRTSGKEMAPRSPAADESDQANVPVRRNLFDYAGGEIGFLYGHSSGKFGGDVEAGYILGEVGNDKFQISVGAAYENSTMRFPRWGR